MVSSVGHKGTKIRWDNLQAEKFFFSFHTYITSKLCNMLFTTELASRIEGNKNTLKKSFKIVINILIIF
jgi:retinol dehydrogenase-12